MKGLADYSYAWARIVNAAAHVALSMRVAQYRRAKEAFNTKYHYIWFNSHAPLTNFAERSPARKMRRKKRPQPAQPHKAYHTCKACCWNQLSIHYERETG